MTPKDCKKRRIALMSQRLPHVTHYADCALYAATHRGDGWIAQEHTDATTIANERAKVLDDTLAVSAHQLTATLISGECPASAQWFDYDDGDAEDEDAASEEGRWLDMAANLVWKNIHASNFDSEVYEATLDKVVYGWGVLFCGEKPEGGYLFEWFPSNQCCIAASKTGGIIDTLFRDYQLSVEQIHAQFTKLGDSIPQNIIAKMETAPDEMIRICHAIYPRQQRKGKSSRGMAYASVHFLQDTGDVLRESGYEEQPFAVGRMNLIPGSAYAVGPVSRALATAKTLNRLKYLQMSSVELNTSGMYKAVDDGVLNPATIKVSPGAIVAVRDKDSLTPLRDGVDFQASFLTEEKLQQQISKIMMADQLQPADGPTMTATEVHMRSQMILAQLGPLAARDQSEFFSVIVDRCFGLLYRAGVLPPPPDSLRGKNIKPRYLSAINRAQRNTDVAAIESAMMSIMQGAQVDPSVMDNVDMDVASRSIVDLRGAGTILRTTEDRDQMRANRAQAEAQQQQAQVLAATAQQAQGVM